MDSHINPHVTVVTATLDDIGRMIDQKTDERMKILKKQNALLDYTVDRAFLERNLKLSRRKIEQYEREGVLRRVYNPSNIKGCYYRMEDCLRLI